MGIPVMILGASGSGKSTSLRNFAPGEIGIFNVAGKPLPFRNKLATIDNCDYNTITSVLKRNSMKTYAIDDSQYLIAFESFAHAKETGYGKFTNMAVNFKSLIDTVRLSTSPDTIVYFLHHTEIDSAGHLKAKTLGQMLDSQLVVEGMFAIVLLATIEGKEHYFITNSDGTNTAKSPLEMFDMKIDNDLKSVDTVIRDYYGLTISKEKEKTADEKNQ